MGGLGVGLGSLLAPPTPLEAAMFRERQAYAQTNVLALKRKQDAIITEAHRNAAYFKDMPA